MVTDFLGTKKKKKKTERKTRTMKEITRRKTKTKTNARKRENEEKEKPSQNKLYSQSSDKVFFGKNNSPIVVFYEQAFIFNPLTCFRPFSCACIARVSENNLSVCSLYLTYLPFAERASKAPYCRRFCRK